MSMHFQKMTVVTARTVGVAAEVDGNVIGKDGIWHPGEAGGMGRALDCRQSNVEDRLDQRVACLAADYPSRVSACQFRGPCLDGFV